uniref:Uncharacterized protein n=1 Tax=Anguilla anguilla TaxID=7936 RepID=A0A0E9UKB6_ANGAN
MEVSFASIFNSVVVSHIVF